MKDLKRFEWIRIGFYFGLGYWLSSFLFESVSSTMIRFLVGLVATTTMKGTYSF